MYLYYHTIELPTLSGAFHGTAFPALACSLPPLAPLEKDEDDELFVHG